MKTVTKEQLDNLQDKINLGEKIIQNLDIWVEDFKILGTTKDYSNGVFFRTIFQGIHLDVMIVKRPNINYLIENYYIRISARYDYQNILADMGEVKFNDMNQSLQKCLKRAENVLNFLSN